MTLPVAHPPQRLNHVLKGRRTSGLFAWSIVLLLIVLFLFPYFLFNQLFVALATYGSLALAPLAVAAYFREYLGVLITWVFILLGMTLSLAIHHGMLWQRAVINNFVFGNLVGLFLGLGIAQFFWTGRQLAETRSLLQVQEQEAARQREAREIQEQLHNLKDQLIFHLSHELRTPLTALQGYLELLSIYQQQLDEARRTEFLERAHQGCVELLELVSNILDVNQFEKGYDAPLEAIALAHIVRSMVEQWDPRVLANYHIQIEVPEDLAVQAAPRHLLQVLRNLFSNALKYSPPHTCVVISAAREIPYPEDPASPPMVRVCIKDQGPGIPPAERALLFNKFTRLKRDLASHVPGTGLGLYICKKLVEAMQGRIWVESSGVAGEGSQFCFQLLAASPEQAEL